MKTQLPIFLFAVLAAGCEIYDPRSGLQDLVWDLTDDTPADPTQAIWKKEYQTWPKSIRDAVDGRLVLVGMTKNQVQVSLHLEEARVQKGAAAAPSEPVESWVVWRLLTGWSPVKRAKSQMVTITFRNGVVSRLDAVTQP